MLSGTLPFSRGYTLGKNIMGITAVYCNELENHDVLEQTVQITSEPLGAARYVNELSKCAYAQRSQHRFKIF